MKGIVLDIIKKILYYYQKIKREDKKRGIIIKWKAEGKPVPPPHAFKQSIIKYYRYLFKYNVFIETGTYKGDMVEACRKLFKQIHSIEISYDLAEQAKELFKAKKHIHIHFGDSSNVLLNILNKINEPVIFWLDGHYSGDTTSKGELNTPILNELMHISNHKNKNHVILIDDARCFNGEDDYPTIESLKNIIFNYFPNASFEVKNDIIRICCRG